jgi:hypothetical protein
VSSNIHASTGSRSTIASSAYCAACRLTSWSLHFESTAKCNNLWCIASTFCGSGQARAAMGSTLLRSASPNSPIAYRAKEPRRLSLPSTSPIR